MGLLLDEVQSMKMDQNAERWQAVLARDALFDGSFVYAVRSTGIYCRPTCPSRRPKRDQVMFYPEPDAAERDGYRPCRRCHPAEAADGAHYEDAVLAARVCEHIEARLEAGDEKLTLALLSRQACVSPHMLQRSFQRAMGITLRQYAEARRLDRFKARLREGESVTGALYEAGYGSSRALYERVDSKLGMTPGTYRKGGLGMMIRYTIVDSPLGRLLVGVSDRGVCRVCLGDSDPTLETALRDEYPRAEIRKDEAGLRSWVEPFLQHLRGTLPHLNLSIDVRATAFERRVWQALRDIPYGTTRSYSEVARAIGRPRAVRAVAHACAVNPVAVVVPCHRVVGKDGKLHGYRWGLDRKQKLLELERRVSQSSTQAARDRAASRPRQAAG